MRSDKTEDGTGKKGGKTARKIKKVQRGTKATVEEEEGKKKQIELVCSRYS